MPGSSSSDSDSSSSSSSSEEERRKKEKKDKDKVRTRAATRTRHTYARRSSASHDAAARRAEAEAQGGEGVEEVEEVEEGEEGQGQEGEEGQGEEREALEARQGEGEAGGDGDRCAPLPPGHRPRARDRTPPLRRLPRRRRLGQVRHPEGGRHVHEAGGVPRLAGRGQGERECQAEGGRPLHPPTMPTTRTTALHVAWLHFARRASALPSLLSRPRSLPRRASCTSTAANGRSRSTSTRFARTTTRRRCPPRSTTTYRRGTPPSRPRGAKRRCATPRGVERGRAPARSGSRACTLASLPHLATRLALTPPHLPPRQVKAVERTSFDDEAERQAEIARGRAERQESVVRVRRCLGLGPGLRARAAAGARVGVEARVRVTAPRRPNPPPPALTHLPKPRPSPQPQP